MSEQRVIPLFDKTVFDFSFLGASESQTIILDPAMVVAPGYYLWLGIRCHNRNFGSGAGTITIETFSTLPSQEDPAEFTNTAAPNLSVTVNSSTGVPSLTIATATAMGPILKVQMKATQIASPTRLYAELSGVLYVRSA